MTILGFIAWCILGASLVVNAETEPFQRTERQNTRVEHTPMPMYMYASQSGRVTLDQGDSGGNPFASALVETLAHETLKFDELLTQVIALTLVKSEGYQRPDVRGDARFSKWQIVPKPDSERRVALVVVFSDYAASDGAQSLPGAARDLTRVGDALERAGFETHRVLDPNRAKLQVVLREFADRSATSDIAALYTTGHGVEVEGTVYLLPGDYPVRSGSASLDKLGIRLADLGGASRAKVANLVFYGGCRNNPFR